MPRLEYERINWQNAPSNETPISAENLNIMDNAIDALFSYLGELEQRIDNLSQQDATNMTATFGEPGEEGVDEAPLQPSGSSIGNIVTGIHSRIRDLQNTEIPKLKAAIRWDTLIPDPDSRQMTDVIAPTSFQGEIVTAIPIASRKIGTSSEEVTDAQGLLFHNVVYNSTERYYSIDCEIVGPIAGGYEIEVLILYYDE